MEENCFLNFVSFNKTEDNEVKILTSAKYEYEKDKQVVTFRETDKEFENCLTKITVENNEVVSIERSGNYTTTISAQKNQRRISQHATPFGTYTLGISLTAFSSDLNEEGGTLSFTYQTDSDFSLVSEIQFTLKIKKKKSV